MSLQYPYPDLPAHGHLQAVADGVFWLRVPLPFQLDHINLWVLRDGDGWTVVDTGFACDQTRAAWRGVLDGLDGPVRRLVVTHFHPDHLGLATWLQAETGAELWMSSGEFLTAHAVWHEVGGHGARFMVEQFRAHGLDGERLARFVERGSGYRKSVPALPETYNRLKAGDTLRIDGKDWELRVGFGHSPEHLALYGKECGVLISGDMLLPKISTNISVFAATPAADALQWFLDALDDMATLPPETLVLPSHGLPFVGIQPRVAALVAHHEARCGDLEKACTDNAKSAAELLPTLFPRALDTHQTMFAMGEAIAHLNYLEKAGRLSCRKDSEGVFRYTRPPAAH